MPLQSMVEVGTTGGVVTRRRNARACKTEVNKGCNSDDRRTKIILKAGRHCRTLSYREVPIVTSYIIINKLNNQARQYAHCSLGILTSLR
jgi:hypothetical protein